MPAIIRYGLDGTGPGPGMEGRFQKFVIRLGKEIVILSITLSNHPSNTNALNLITLNESPLTPSLSPAGKGEGAPFLHLSIHKTSQKNFLTPIFFILQGLPRIDW